MPSSELLSQATAALQAQETLSWKIGQTDVKSCTLLKNKIHDCLNTLREQKATLEGSDLDFKLPKLNEHGLVELKQLTLMHIPSSLTDDVRDKFKILVDQALDNECKSVVSITLLTCPWYEISQRERGEQAKHNILLVVFSSLDEQFFSPVNPQIREQACVLDLGWLCAVELSHFGHALAKGRTRYLETVHSRDGALIWETSCWKELRQNLTYRNFISTHSFLMASVGQALGGVGKKKKNGVFKLREGATLFELCESFRLLEHAENALNLATSTEEKDGLSPFSSQAKEKIKLFYEHEEPVKFKYELFDLLMNWADELKKSITVKKSVAEKNQETELEKVIGEWLMRTRLHGRKLMPLPALSDSHSSLVKLMKEVGGPVARMRPEQILLVAVAGSAMYNLSTPTSDVDYLVVYAHPTELLLSATKKLAETHESRGVDKTIEYGAYEVRTFCEMVLKCSVVILELLFSTGHKYTSPMWEELAQHKSCFVTEKAILQYLGLVKNNFKLIERRKHSGSPSRDRKLFYQIFHKLHSLQYMMTGQVPPVRLEGDTREFIMNVRTQDEGQWSRENILIAAKEQYVELREKLCGRTVRLRENPDYELCTNWLLKVRGIDRTEREC